MVTTPREVFRSTPPSPSAGRDSRSAPLLAVATGLLSILILATPLPFGSVLPPGHLLVELLAFSAAATAFAGRPPNRVFGLAAIPLFALVTISVFGLLQLLPLPRDLLGGISPWSLAVHDEANALLRQFERPPVNGRISVAPFSTASAALLTLAYAAAFAAAAIVSSGSKWRRRVLVWTLLSASLLHVFIGAAVAGTSNRIHGAFINPNHFAGYLQIAAAFGFGTIWLELLKSRERGSASHDIGERFQRRAVPIALRILLWAVIAAGIGLTRSRGGILAAALTIILLLGLATFQRTMRSRRAVIPTYLALFAGITFVAVSVGRAPLFRFLSADPRELESDTRVQIWRGSLDAFHQSPIVGSGLGTFREAFRHVQPEEVVGLVEQAHNDFLQMLVTGGTIGATLAVLAAASMLILLVRRWAQQVHREESAFALAGIGALVALLLHGLVEFNMSIPAIPVTLATMLGVSWAAANVATDESQ